MRDILFRGKRIDNGEWVYGYLIAPEFAPNKKYIGHLFAEDDHDVDVAEVECFVLLVLVHYKQAVGAVGLGHHGAGDTYICGESEYMFFHFL